MANNIDQDKVYKHIRELERELIQKTDENLVLQHELDKRKKKNKARKEEIKSLKIENNNLRIHNKNLQNTIKALKKSLSWKLTAPLRAVLDMITGNTTKSK